MWVKLINLANMLTVTGSVKLLLATVLRVLSFKIENTLAVCTNTIKAFSFVSGASVIFSCKILQFWITVTQVKIQCK